MIIFILSIIANVYLWMSTCAAKLWSLEDEGPLECYWSLSFLSWLDTITFVFYWTNFLDHGKLDTNIKEKCRMLFWIVCNRSIFNWDKDNHSKDLWQAVKASLAYLWGSLVYLWCVAKNLISRLWWRPQSLKALSLFRVINVWSCISFSLV